MDRFKKVFPIIFFFSGLVTQLALGFQGSLQIRNRATTILLPILTDRVGQSTLFRRRYHDYMSREAYNDDKQVYATDESAFTQNLRGGVFNLIGATSKFFVAILVALSLWLSNSLVSHTFELSQFKIFTKQSIYLKFKFFEFYLFIYS